MSKKLPRGIRLNNPGNIERNGIDWIGLSDTQPDPRFCTFIKPVYGIRAMVRILMTYNGRGADTIREIISAWAPKHENPLQAYIDFVCRETAAGADEVLDIDNPHDIIPLLQAIVKFENGQQPYPYETFETAYYMATGKEKTWSNSLASPSNTPTPSSAGPLRSLLAALFGWFVKPKRR